VTIALFDWIIEAYAHEKGLWFCYGGYQKIGKLDFKHVPVDMVIGFICTGFSLAIVTYFPQLLRSWGWDFWPISDPAWDSVGIVLILVGMSLFGAFADFRSKRTGVWMNGPGWNYWKCAFYAWLPLLSSGILVDRVILFSWTNPIYLTLVICTIFLTLTIIIIILIFRVLR
jgi:hypothetical protein